MDDDDTVSAQGEQSQSQDYVKMVEEFERKEARKRERTAAKAAACGSPSDGVIVADTGPSEAAALGDGGSKSEAAAALTGDALPIELVDDTAADRPGGTSAPAARTKAGGRRKVSAGEGQPSKGGEGWRMGEGAMGQWETVEGEGGKEEREEGGGGGKWSRASLSRGHGHGFRRARGHVSEAYPRCKRTGTRWACGAAALHAHGGLHRSAWAWCFSLE